MDSSPNLTLPYIIAAQAQKHVTHNEAIRALDALVQLMVLDKDLASPPGSPADGNRYIVAASPTGAWAGQAGKVAAYQDGTWEFFAPRDGWLAWVADEDRIYAHNGTTWAELTVSAGSGASTWGINATADTTNRLAVKSTASLFDNVGAGHQQKINKNAAGDTASTLYQTNYSGRAELGLAGDDDFHVKVSPNGSSWLEALVVDRTTGAARFPNTPYLDLPAGSAPATPASGKVRVYAKTDKSLYQKDDAGLETGLAGGGGLSVLFDYLSGLTLSNNGCDATNDIDIAVGVACASDQSAMLTLAAGLTKRLDAAWVVGTNQGGLDTGSIANTTYHVWLIRRSDTGVVDALFSTSATSPTMPTSYDQKRRIGSILRESGTIIPFTQDGDFFRRTNSKQVTTSANPGTSPVTVTLAVPIGIKVFALLNAHVTSATTPAGVYVSPLIATAEHPTSGTGVPGATTRGNSAQDGRVGNIEEYTDTSAQIRYEVSASDANTNVYIFVLGWRDGRSRH